MKGEKETAMLEKSEGDTIQKLFRGRIQNVWGEGHGGEARLSRGGGRGITSLAHGSSSAGPTTL